VDVDDEEDYRNYLEGRTPAESGLELPQTPNRRSRLGRA
jgi:hypothetical protein